METMNQIMVYCGWIITIGAVAGLIWKWIKPAIKLTERVEALERQAEQDREDSKTRYNSMKDIMEKFSERDSLILQTLITLLDSHLTGNNEAELKKTRDKLTEYLVQNQS